MEFTSTEKQLLHLAFGIIEEMVFDFDVSDHFNNKGISEDDVENLKRKIGFEEDYQGT